MSRIAAADSQVLARLTETKTWVTASADRLAAFLSGVEATGLAKLTGEDRLFLEAAEDDLKERRTTVDPAVVMAMIRSWLPSNAT